MGIDIRYPQLSAPDEAGKLRQVESYLCQLRDQLQFALQAVDQQAAQTGQAIAQQATASQKLAKNQESKAVFNSIKSLIIKSADIVEAYSQEIGAKLSGEYVAQSAYGTFRETTEASFLATSQKIDQVYSDIQQISDTVGGVADSLIQVTAYIRTGLLSYDGSGAPVYGVEIGQQNSDGQTVSFQKYARLTAGKLSFFDSNDSEVAYISDYKLHITQADIGSLTAGTAAVGELQIGNYTLRINGSGHLIIS